jgi:hypothetical protein
MSGWQKGGEEGKSRDEEEERDREDRKNKSYNIEKHYIYEVDLRQLIKSVLYYDT